MIVDQILATYMKDGDQAGLFVCSYPFQRQLTPNQQEVWERLIPLTEAARGHRSAFERLRAQALINLDFTVLATIVSTGCLAQLLLALICYARMRRAEAIGLCPVCRYDLRATPHR